MKHLGDIKKEYGYILRWSNGGGNEAGETCPTTYYLENFNSDRPIVEIKTTDAIEYIKNKMPGDGFRQHISVYDNYIGLFSLLGVKPLKTFKELLKERNMGVNQLARESGIATSKSSDLNRGASSFREVKLYNAIRIAKALGMTVEEMYNFLYK